MQHVFNELLARTDNLLYLQEPSPYQSYAEYMGRTVRRCRGGCMRWIRFCTAEYTVCGSCKDRKRMEMEDEEEHRYGMKILMDELTANANRDRLL